MTMVVYQRDEEVSSAASACYYKLVAELYNQLDNPATEGIVRKLVDHKFLTKIYGKS